MHRIRLTKARSGQPGKANGAEDVDSQRLLYRDLNSLRLLPFARQVSR